MTPRSLKDARQSLGLTQAELAERLHTTRTTVARYECGERRIPGIIKVALAQLTSLSQIPMVGIVAAGDPIEPISQADLVEVPPSMIRGEENFALRVKGESMRDEGILPGDVIIVHKQETARNGQTVVALVNNEATVKKYYRKAGRTELHPANSTMSPILLTPQDELRIEGIVVGVIRHCE